jgi:arylsulfatase A-like enzyme
MSAAHSTSVEHPEKSRDVCADAAGEERSGRTIRTARYKYVRYQGDPAEQLFDLQADPWETQNLHEDSKYADVVKGHRKLLEQWESKLIPA